MKDTKALLLLFVSLCLVGTWVYHVYDKNKYLSNQTIVQVKDSAIIQKAVNDSLRSLYSNTLFHIDSVNNKEDSLNNTLSTRLSEIDSLKNEITTILNMNNITREDLKRADEKILQLQQKMKEQNKAAITQQPNTTEVETKLNSPALKNPVPVNSGNAASFAVADISLKAIKPVTGGVGISTNKAIEAEHFSIAFALVSNNTSFNETEVYLVLTDPMGNVIQDDQWQAGLFSTRNNVRIPYTRKNDFDYTKGEVKRFTTHLKLSEFNPGLYNVQVYHNGIRIGRADLRLN